MTISQVHWHCSPQCTYEPDTIYNTWIHYTSNIY